MKIAIVEDRKEDTEALQQMLQEYMEERHIAGEILCFSSGDALLEQFRPGYFQCIFLDIYMEGTDGMETARKIYQQDSLCRLIFATISLSHAVSGYGVRAAWYLVKPFDKKQLTEAMDVACEAILQNSRMLTVHVNGTKADILYTDIFYIDSETRKTRLHLLEHTLTVDEPVQELLKHLSGDERFLVCNRNILVNMDQIQRAEEADFLLKNGSHVPLRQRGRAQVKKAFLAWTLRELRKEETH
ncbi:LytR/AlgR family response regulator transcription factor [Anaerotignum sp.]